MTETAPAATALPDGDIIAGASRTYRLKWCAMGILLLAAGWWFLYDGYVGYPAENEQARQKAVADGKPLPERLHSAHDMWLQKVLGVALQPVGLLGLFWAIYSSRGAYRLSGTTLSVPGHPPVPFEGIRVIDKSKWDRKGIAYLEYEVPGSAGAATRRLALDDYLYEREPTDEILARVEAAVAPSERAAPRAVDGA